MKRIPQFSVDNPVTVSMIVLAVLLTGYISFSRLGMDLFPDIESPKIFVEIESGELPPEEIERKYVETIEAQASQQKNVTDVTSISRVGTARVTVEYAWNTDMDEAFLNLQKALASIKQDEEIDDLAITHYDPNASPVVLLSFSRPGFDDLDDLRMTAESYLRNELVRLEGIADVRLLGEETKEVVIETDPYLLEAFAITPETLASRITEYNRNISGGSIEEMGTQYIIKGISELTSLDDIKSIIVAYKDPSTAGGQGTTASTDTESESIPVLLSEVATVSFSPKEPDTIVSINGKGSIGIAVYKEMKYNTVQAVEDCIAAVESIQKNLPGYELTIVQNQGDFIIGAIDEVKETALIGILLAVFVLFVFLRHIGTTFVISIAIPISIVATFNLMYFNGLTLNIMTLGGLALGAGMLVDNAIVVLESITRNIESGKSVVRASIDGTSQVGGAITASTITTIVVFLPIVYLHGSAGELFREQAWTVAFSLVSSLVVALLVIPVLSARLMKRKNGTSPKIADNPDQYGSYGRFLGRILKIRWWIVACAILLVILSIQLVSTIGSEFIPKTGSRGFTIEVTLPEGTDLKRTASAVDDIGNGILDLYGDEIATLFSVSGPSDDTMGSGAQFEDENTAAITVVLDPEGAIDTNTIMAGAASLISGIPEIEARFTQEQSALEFTLGSDQAPVAVEIRGEDIDILREYTEKLAERMSGIESMVNVETTFEDGRPEIDIVIDRVRAGILGIGINTVTTQLQNRLTGTDAGEFDDSGEMRDITIKLPDVSVSDIEDMTIDNNGQKIPIYDFAELAISNAPREIHRTNQVRTGKVTADIKPGTPLDRAVGFVEAELASLALPPGYRYAIIGEEQHRREAFENLKFALILSLILVYMVLASQFESLIHPFTIILSIPLAAVGTVVLFFLIGQPFSIMAYIGLIMLVGIAVNDSIILVDAINRFKQDGLSRRDAIVKAGKHRIRPIIMTSLTTIMALIPLAVGFGEGAALRAPMALAVIGGLITSTLLTLVVIPCVYDILDVFSKK